MTSSSLGDAITWWRADLSLPFPTLLLGGGGGFGGIGGGDGGVGGGVQEAREAVNHSTAA